MNKNRLIETKNLTKIYSDGNVRALKNINFSIDEGEYVVIKGASGSGKSTLLHLLGGLDRPTDGQIYFEKQDLNTIRHKAFFRLTTIGFVFQAFYLWPALNVFENIFLPLMETGLNRKEKNNRIKVLIKRVGLEKKMYAQVSDLSVGERQRVAIARALVNKPRLLLADEPTGSLDAKNRDAVLELFKEFHLEKEITIIMVTHEHVSARQFNRMLELRDGEIVEK